MIALVLGVVVFAAVYLRFEHWRKVARKVMIVRTYVDASGNYTVLIARKRGQVCEFVAVAPKPLAENMAKMYDALAKAVAAAFKKMTKFYTTYEQSVRRYS